MTIIIFSPLAMAFSRPST